MKTQYHILNGDALKDQFPDTLKGVILVARECLVDGNVKGKDLEEMFQSRATFLSENYGGTVQDYYDKTVVEFDKIRNIDDDSEINLWFEDDLFCQVNFWFVAYLLQQRQRKNAIYLVRPKTHTYYGFGGLNKKALIDVFQEKTLLTDLRAIADLWEIYQNGKIAHMLIRAQELALHYPFIVRAVQAHIDRVPSAGNLGKPSAALYDIMKELDTEEFEPVFKEFCRREPIYGFGDLGKTTPKRFKEELKSSYKGEK